MRSPLYQNRAHLCEMGLHPVSLRINQCGFWLQKLTVFLVHEPKQRCSIIKSWCVMAWQALCKDMTSAHAPTFSLHTAFRSYREGDPWSDLITQHDDQCYVCSDRVTLVNSARSKAGPAGLHGARTYINCVLCLSRHQSPYRQNKSADICHARFQSKIHACGHIAQSDHWDYEQNSVDGKLGFESAM